MPDSIVNRVLRVVRRLLPAEPAGAADDAELLHRFVQSHGPVPLQDFAGWSGLPLRDAKAAAAANAGRVRAVATEVGELWATETLAQQMAGDGFATHPVVVTPGFDEFILGYKDRGLQVPDGAMRTAPSAVVPGTMTVLIPLSLRIFSRSVPTNLSALEATISSPAFGATGGRMSSALVEVVML